MIVRIISEQPDLITLKCEVTTFSRRTHEQSDCSGAVSLVEVFDWIRMLDTNSCSSVFVRIGLYKLGISRAPCKTESKIAGVKICKAEE